MSVGTEIRYAVRCLWKDKKVAGAVAACLALGIGANAAMFDAVDTLLFRPPPLVERPAEIVRLYGSREIPQIGRITSGRFSYPAFTDLETVQGFAATAAYFPDELSLGRGAGAKKVRVAFVTPDFFELLGISATEGRLFEADEGTPERCAEVAIVRAGSNASVLGEDVSLGQGRYRVVGVLPEDFKGLDLERVDVYLPISGLQTVFGVDWEVSRGSKLLEIVARLAPGATPEVAAAEATAALEAGARDEVGAAVGNVELGPLAKARGPNQPSEVRVSLWLGAISLIVLLLACVNVSNLLLSRAVRRQRENAIRCALGASRSILVRQALVESLLLAAVSGCAALFVVATAGRLIRGNLVPGVQGEVPWADVRTLAWTVCAAFVAGLVAGLVPALRASRPRLQSQLQRGGGDGSGKGDGERLRQTLLASQVALAVVLVMGACLFVQSLDRALKTDLGLDSDRLLVTASELVETGWEPREIDRVAHEMLETVRGLPGVERAALVAGLPFRSSFGANLEVPGRAVPTLSTGGPYLNAVSGEYFRTVGAAIQRGDSFASRGAGLADSPAAIVNATMARSIWPDEDPIGRCVLLDADAGSGRCTKVIGVVEDIRRQGLREEPTMQIYVPLEQAPAWINSRVLLARTSSEPSATADLVGGQIRGLRDDLPFMSVQPMTELLAPQLRPWRLGASVLSLFALLALVLGLLGVYSLVSFQVAERRRELGVRMALGASFRRVTLSIVRQGALITAVGVLGGVAVITLVGNRIAPLLYDIAPLDLPTLLLTCGAVVATVCLASLVPARGICSIDPAQSLRGD